MADAIYTRVDASEVYRIAEQAGRTIRRTHYVVDRNTRSATNKTVEYVRRATPVYEGGGKGNIPGGLRQAWQADATASWYNEEISYTITTGQAESRAGTNWAIPYAAVVGFLEEGVYKPQIVPVNTKALAWNDSDGPVRSTRPHEVEPAPFLEDALQDADSAGVFERCAWDIAFEIENGVLWGRI